MFGRKSGGSAAGLDKAPDKEKKVSPKEALAQQFRGLEPGKELTYELGPIYVKPFISVLHNADPARGKEFHVFQDARATDGKPAGRRGKFWETNNPVEVGGWITEREGRAYPR